MYKPGDIVQFRSSKESMDNQYIKFQNYVVISYPLHSAYARHTGAMPDSVRIFALNVCGTPYWAKITHHFGVVEDLE